MVLGKQDPAMQMDLVQVEYVPAHCRSVGLGEL